MPFNLQYIWIGLTHSFICANIICKSTGFNTEKKTFKLLHVVYYFIYFSIRKAFYIIFFGKKILQIVVLYLKLILCIRKEGNFSKLNATSVTAIFLKSILVSIQGLCDLYYKFYILKQTCHYFSTIVRNLCNY